MTTTAARAHLSLRDALLGGENSLNCIRLILAVLVMISHAPYLSLGIAATDAIPLLNKSHLLGDYAVNMFFCISGFLIAHSAQRGTVAGYLKRRVLRIFPGYWASLVFVLCVGAPVAVATSHTATGWDWDQVADYVGANFDLFFLQYSLFGGPTNLPYGQSWNGSAWTLSYEFLGYLLLVPLFYVPALKSRARALVPVVFAVSLVPFFVFTAVGASTNTLWEVARLYPMFMAGVVLYMWGDRVRLNPVLVMGCCVASAVLQFTAPTVVLQLIPLVYAYGVLSLGALVRTRWCQQIDISYGMYIYAWPVQVILLMLGTEPLGWAANAVLTVAATAPIAWLSWCAIEKPAMALKNRPFTPVRIAPVCLEYQQLLRARTGKTHQKNQTRTEPQQVLAHADTQQKR